MFLLKPAAITNSQAADFSNKVMFNLESLIAKISGKSVNQISSSDLNKIRFSAMGNAFNFKTRLRDFYNQKKNSIKLIFLGSSHAYRAFNPKIFKNNLKINSFNMGSSSQSPIESYYTLNQILKYQKPKLIVYEVYWEMFEDKRPFDAKSYENSLLKSTVMRFSSKKEQYINSIFTSDKYIQAWKNLFKNRKMDYGECYCGKGFVENNTVANQSMLQSNNTFKNIAQFKVNPLQIKYFNRIVNLCKAKKIKLILVTVPIPPSSLAMVKNYTGIHNYFYTLAKKYKLKYYDYNYLNRKLKLLTDKDFKDSDHINNYGVKILDKHFSKYISI